ncbi:MAG: sugar ABC transporter permease, partial [Nocardioidaceae bacterium]
ADERLVRQTRLAGIVQGFRRRVTGGDLGTLPVIIGLLVIAVVFYSQDKTFLSSASLVNITLFAAPFGIISLGIVLVLLLGEIDLSVGSVSGLAGSVSAVLIVYHGWPAWVGLLAGAATGFAIGLFYGLVRTRIGVPSFVISLAGLLSFMGAQYAVLGTNGTINLDKGSGLAHFARTDFLGHTTSYIVVVGVVVVYAGSRYLGIRRRTAAGLSAPSLGLLAAKAVGMLVVLEYLTYYLNIGRGWGYLFVLFVGLVVLVDLALRKTTWGRHVYAVGGNEEAARRAGIKVNRIYLSVFALTSTFAAVGGLMFLAQLTSVSQSSGSADVNLTAIAAAVIGGTSLFGGRGSAYAALLGILVLQSIISGLQLMHVDSSIRFIVTGAVLLLAVSIDSVSRRARSSSGRG